MKSLGSQLFKIHIWFYLVNWQFVFPQTTLSTMLLFTFPILMKWLRIFSKIVFSNNFLQWLSTTRRRTSRTSSTVPGSLTTEAAASSWSRSSWGTRASSTARCRRPDSTRNGFRAGKSSWPSWAVNTSRGRMESSRARSLTPTSRSGYEATLTTARTEGTDEGLSTLERLMAWMKCW